MGDTHRSRHRRHLSHLHLDAALRHHLQPVLDRRRTPGADSYRRIWGGPERQAGDRGSARSGAAGVCRAPALGRRRERRHGSLPERGARRGARRLRALDHAQCSRSASTSRIPGQQGLRRDARARTPHAALRRNAARASLGLDDGRRREAPTASSRPTSSCSRAISRPS